MFIDTHCHLDDEKIEDKALAYRNMSEAGVKIAVNMAVNDKSSLQGQKLSEKFDGVYFGCGFHPSDCAFYGVKAEDFLIGISKHEKCVAIGEIGLDYHYGTDDEDVQKKCFVSQLELAHFLKLPVSVHSRDATEDTLKILKNNKDKIDGNVVIHCFSGSVETAREYVKLGCYVSFAGTLTFKNAVNLRAVAKSLPIEAILAETDSPYLSPEPMRGKINSPANVVKVYEKLAEIRGEELSALSFSVCKNALSVFKKIKPDGVNLKP